MALADVEVETPAPQATAQQVKKAPAFVPGSMEDMILAAATDLRSLQENDRAYIRYFNFVNARLPFIGCNPDGTAPDPMQYLHAGLNKLINSLSLSPRLTKVVPVDETDGALVRIDIRDYDWTEDDWRIVSEGVYGEAVADAGFSAEAWEDLAEVYPYAIDPSSDPLMSVIADVTQASVPIMDADWFARYSSQSPYYDVLLKLTDDVVDLERRIGVDADYEISKGNVVRAGFTGSGVSDHNRMLERFDLPRQGYYWKSYDFAEDSGAQLLLTHPDGPSSVSQLSSGTTPFEHDGGEMIFSLPNGLLGYSVTSRSEKVLKFSTPDLALIATRMGSCVKMMRSGPMFSYLTGSHETNVTHCSKCTRLKKKLTATTGKIPRHSSERLKNWTLWRPLLPGIWSVFVDPQHLVALKS